MGLELSDFLSREFIILFSFFFLVYENLKANWIFNIVANLSLVTIKGLTLGQQPVVKLFKLFVKPCSITNPILVRNGDGDVETALQAIVGRNSVIS